MNFLLQRPMILQEDLKKDFLIALELIPTEVHCRLPPNVSTNGSIPTVREPITGQEVLSQCDVYQDYDVSTNTTIGCPDGWFYFEEVYTIVNQVIDLITLITLIRNSQLEAFFQIHNLGIFRLIVIYESTNLNGSPGLGSQIHPN